MAGDTSITFVADTASYTNQGEPYQDSLQSTVTVTNLQPGANVESCYMVWLHYYTIDGTRYPNVGDANAYTMLEPWTVRDTNNLSHEETINVTTEYDNVDTSLAFTGSGNCHVPGERPMVVNYSIGIGWIANGTNAVYWYADASDGILTGG